MLELVPGRSWRAALEEAGQWSPQFALPLFRDVLNGLACAHDAGIIHRDLKAENILLAPAACSDSSALTARILDFGLAKIRAEEDALSICPPLPDRRALAATRVTAAMYKAVEGGKDSL